MPAQVNAGDARSLRPRWKPPPANPFTIHLVIEMATRLDQARLRGEATHRARWDPLSPGEIAGAVVAVRNILAGRDDGPALLAQVVGLLTGRRGSCTTSPSTAAAGTRSPRQRPARRGGGGRCTPARAGRARRCGPHRHYRYGHSRRSVPVCLPSPG